MDDDKVASAMTGAEYNARVADLLDALRSVFGYIQSLGELCVQRSPDGDWSVGAMTNAKAFESCATHEDLLQATRLASEWAASRIQRIVVAREADTRQIVADGKELQVLLHKLKTEAVS
jgi:hypothetical protein